MTKKKCKNTLLKSHTKSASKNKRKVWLYLNYLCRSEEAIEISGVNWTGSGQGPMEFPWWGLEVSARKPATLIEVLNSFLPFLEATVRNVLRLEPHLFLPNSILPWFVNLPILRQHIDLFWGTECAVKQNTSKEILNHQVRLNIQRIYTAFLIRNYRGVSGKAKNLIFFWRTSIS